MLASNSKRKAEQKPSIIFWNISVSYFSCKLILCYKCFISVSIIVYDIILRICLYNLVKKKTPQNIVIGGASGALPPVIGWAIATNSISLESIAFFLIIFFWTPSHFWALSLYKADDYKKAGIPMLPVTNGIHRY